MPRGAGPSERIDRPSLVPGGALVLAVLALLLFAAARQVDSAAVASEHRPASPPAARAPDPAPTAEPAWNPARVVADEKAVLDPLSRRTLEDPVRIARDGEFTLQIAFNCSRETALRLLERAASERELYVLPAVAQGGDCYRFCWGAYDRKERATSAVLPESLKSAGLGAPSARRIHELIP